MLDHLLAKNMVYIRGSGEKVGREAFSLRSQSLASSLSRSSSPTDSS